MENNFENILDTALKEIENGIPIEQVLTKYKKYQQELMEFLELANNLKGLPEPEYRQEAFNYALFKAGKQIAKNQGYENALLKNGNEQGNDKKAFFERIKNRLEQTFISINLGSRILFNALPGKVIAILLSVYMVGWFSVKISASSGPDNALYPIKIASERVKLYLTFNKEREAELHIVYADKRLSELATSVIKNKDIKAELVNSALNEIDNSLNKILHLDPDKSRLLLIKLKSANNYQKMVFENTKKSVKTKSELIDKAIELCSQRTEWLDKNMSMAKNSCQGNCSMMSKDGFPCMMMKK